MSNVSSGSSGSSTRRWRGHGIPKVCWCGQAIVELLSRTDENPFRRFFRCSYAADLKLKNDKHVFKWIDEGLINEVESIDQKFKSLEEDVKYMKKILTEGVEFEKRRFEKLEIELEGKLTERMEVAISDAKTRLWKTMCFVFVLGFLSIVGCSYLVG